MEQIIIIVLTVILVDNFVLTQFLGICPFLGVSKKLDAAAGMGIAVTFVMVLATAATYPIQKFILEPAKLEFLQTLVFILVIASLVQLVEITLKKYLPGLYKSLGVFLALITTNCAVLGVTIMNVEEARGFSYVEALFNAFGAGMGFLLAMVLFAGLRRRLEDASLVPESFKGIPITLITASILSTSFMGLAGVIEGLFA